MSFSIGDYVDTPLGRGVIVDPPLIHSLPPAHWVQILYTSEITIIKEENMWKPKNINKCECGAHSLREFNNFHADWCPLFRKDF